MDMGCVVVTGAAGGIGQALVRAFADAGHAVVATDAREPPPGLPCAHFVACDLQATVADEARAAEAFAAIRAALDGRPLAALVNNAAVQVLGDTAALDRAAWRATLDVNVLAPFLWTQALLPELEAARGMVLNIGSIHARLTKPGFVAYATSKGALATMTRALAVDIGARVRVNAIEPAAIGTAMLEAGFAEDPRGFSRLEQCHPQGRIGTPEEVAALAVAMCSGAMRFMHGACVGIDGGISGRLHDPA